MRNPGDAIAHGVGFVTEDRKSQGLVLGMSVRENFSLTPLSEYCAFDFVNERREYVQTLGVKTPSINQRVVNLSDGDQQKVVIAKRVARKPKVLAVTDRIIVIKDGRIGGELPRAQASQERVMAAATD
jgi:ABC-type sugar transport system ATPase subunit